MTQQKIIEGNKLIAQFLGLTIITDEISLFDTNYKPLAKYHKSWNRLIPIINKIYENDWYYKWKDTSGQFEKEVFINSKFIETTWEQVVEFIKWYNENKNK